jgi:DNA-directed RNA polymerase III subunit RPC1
LECHQRDLYDLNLPNRPPAQFGVLDRNLGTSSKAETCATCAENMQDCVGHFGVIRLCLPVFHIGIFHCIHHSGYFKLMVTILQNICKVSNFEMLIFERRAVKY